MKKIIILFFSLLVSCDNNEKFIKSPFNNLDTLSTNDWWNRQDNPIIDLKVDRDDVIAFGMYTVSNNTLKLSAQLFPLYPNESREVRLEIYQDENWKEIQKKNINEIGWAITFRIENWDDSKDIKYRLRHSKNSIFEGLVRKDPKDKNEILMAAFSCNSNKDRGDREYYVKNILYNVGSCNHSDITTFSFHPLKPITTGEGGLLSTNNKK